VTALRPRIVTIHCRNVGPDLGDSYWGRRDRGRAPLGEQSGPDFYTTFDLAQIKVWSLLCDTALMSQPSRLVRLSVQSPDTLRFLGRHLAAMTEHGVHRLRCQFVAARHERSVGTPLADSHKLDERTPTVLALSR